MSITKGLIKYTICGLLSIQWGIRVWALALSNSAFETKHQVSQYNQEIYRPTPPGHIAQSVKCLTADPGVASLIPARSHTYVEIDHEIISTAILLPSAVSWRVVVSYKRKYVH